MLQFELTTKSGIWDWCLKYLIPSKILSRCLSLWFEQWENVDSESLWCTYKKLQKLLCSFWKMLHNWWRAIPVVCTTALSMWLVHMKLLTSILLVFWADLRLWQNGYEMLWRKCLKADVNRERCLWIIEEMNASFITTRKQDMDLLD